MITLSQKGYIDAILEQFNYGDANPSWMPMVTQKMGGLTKESNLNPREEDYCSIVGSLMYLMIMARPDLANSVGIISRYLSNPSEEHLTAAKHILRYVKRTREHILTLGYSNDIKEPFDLYRYADANWGNDVDTRKSTTGYVFYARRGAVCWCSKRQPIIALSTMEAKYITLCTSVQEALWLCSLLEEVKYPLFSSKVPTMIFEDN